MSFLQVGYVRWDGKKYVTDPNVKIVGSVGGDLTGNYPNPIVVGIQGNPISEVLPTGGQFLVENSAGTGSAWTTLGGDLSLSTSTVGSASVIKINGSTVPAGGALTTGNVLQVSGISALSYGPINLAGGTNYITGLLPLTNFTNGTPSQVLMTNGSSANTWTTITGDTTISNTGATTTAKVNGTSVPASPSANQLLAASSGTTATWKTIGDANITAGGINNVSIGASAAIAGSKISPVFGAQAITNTSTISVGSTTGNNTLSGGFIYPPTLVNSNISLSDGYYLLDVNTTGGAITITLPTPVAGRTIVFKDIAYNFATNNLTIAQNASEKIEGVAASKVISATGWYGALYSNGTDWFLLN